MKTVAALGALLAVAACVISPPTVAHATPPFVGSYTAIQKPSMIDAPAGAHIAQPDQNGIWNVESSCSLQGCLAHVVLGKASTEFDMIFNGTTWDRLAVPQIAICNGATVPARSAHEVLSPQANGSLSGALTTTVDCDGATVDLSLPLTLTPA